MKMRGCVGPARADALSADQAAIELGIVGRPHVRRGSSLGRAGRQRTSPPPRRPRRARAARLPRRPCQRLAGLDVRRDERRAGCAWPMERTAAQWLEGSLAEARTSLRAACQSPAAGAAPRDAAGVPARTSPSAAPAPPRRLRAPCRNRACGRPPARARAAPRRTSAAVIPSRHSGCLSSAISATGSNSRAAASAIRSRNAPIAVLAKRLAGRVVDAQAPSLRAGPRRGAPAAGRARPAPPSGPASPPPRAGSGRSPRPRPRRSAPPGWRQPAKRRAAISRLLAPAMNRCQRSVVPAGRMASLTSDGARLLRRARRRRPAAAARPRGARPAHPAASSCRTAGARDAPGSDRVSSSPRRASGRAPGSTSGAVRQPGHRAQQLRHGRHAAHDAGDDHGRAGGGACSAAARPAPAPALVAARIFETQPLLGEMRRPVLGHDPQESQRPLPVLGERRRAPASACARDRRPRSPSRPSAGPARARAWPPAPGCRARAA